MSLSWSELMVVGVVALIVTLATLGLAVPGMVPSEYSPIKRAWVDLKMATPAP